MNISPNRHGPRTETQRATPVTSADDQREEIAERFMLAYARGEPLQEWLARYPQYARDLAELALGLEAQRRLPSAPADEVAFVRSAMLKVLEELPLGSSSEPALGLAARARALKIGIPDLARRLRLTPDLLVKLDQGYIRLETVPRRFLAHVAQGLETTAEALLRGLQAGPQVAGGMAFYTKGRPQAAQQQTFAAALDQAGGMPAAERARWIAAAREEGIAP